MDFANYVDSEDITDSTTEKEIAITLMPPVRDLTSLENDTRYRYRSMAEFNITFVADASGAYGIGGMLTVPNTSGGGTTQMVETQIDKIESIEIEGGLYDEE
jgi:hypothetical protein